MLKINFIGSSHIYWDAETIRIKDDHFWILNGHNRVLAVIPRSARVTIELVPPGDFRQAVAELKQIAENPRRLRWADREVLRALKKELRPFHMQHGWKCKP